MIVATMVWEQGMTLTVDLTPEEMGRLVETAKAKGVSVDTLIRGVLRDLAAGSKSPAGPVLLPKWPGRAIGDLRREDLYDDVP